MIMKQSVSRSREAGAIDAKRIIIALFAAVMLLGMSALGEEDGRMSQYTLNEFEAYWGMDGALDDGDALEHTITIAHLSDTGISLDTMVEDFPNFATVRDLPSTEETEKYLAYDLSDGSSLYVFVENGSIAFACRMQPRCSAANFESIVIGRSTPEEVVQIDSNAVFNPFIQWGPVSYHCLMDATFREVTYEQMWLSEEQFEFVVSGIRTIDQSECLSVLKYIDVDDMP